MRLPRIKAPEGESGLYHCIERIVGGDYLLGDIEKEMYIKIMWQVADFLSIDILDYVVMDTHGHKFAMTPAKVELSDEELLKRLQTYYGVKSSEARSFEKRMQFGGEALSQLRHKYMRRMGDISEFEKSHKQKFTNWYNRRQKRKGTLWMERFNSLLVENSKEARLSVAAYLDLNPIRAEITSDPKNYRFCAYAAALGGDERCRRGLMRVVGLDDWDKASSEYRMFLITEGAKERVGKRGKISKELISKTIEANGTLPKRDLFRLRIRYFTEGLVLGSAEFVNNVFERHRSCFSEKRKTGASKLKGFGTSELRVLNPLREDPIG